jgi:cobalt-zinc-cadmium efflux system outer membrane protein
MKITFLGTILVLAITAQAQTIPLTLQQTDSLLQVHSLAMIAARYDIDIAQAQVAQARLFENPVFNAEINFYNPNKRKYFDAGTNGQKVLSLQQIIHIAGQRNKAIRVANEQAKLTEAEFYDLSRTLKFQARSSLYALFFQDNSLTHIDAQLQLLYSTIQAFKIQFDKGNVSLKDYTRLQASYYALNNNRSEIVKMRLDTEQTLQTLLGITDGIKPVIKAQDVDKYNLTKIDTIEASALALQRPDVMASQALTFVHASNVSYQKSLRMPNLVLGGLYDQAGSYVNHYTALTAGIQIPIFNRNQGNIKAAQAMFNQSRTNYELKKLSAQNEWKAGYKKLVQIDAEYQKVDKDFPAQLDLLNRNLISNYTKNNLTLLEFTDLFESYNEALIQINNLNIQRVSAFEELNYLSGTDLIK